MSKPIVAVVGRPNVGKSTLFNKIVGSRVSIVEDTPGVTRDRIYAEAEWSGVPFRHLSIPAVSNRIADDIILSQMREQAQIAIDTADVIIFIVDGRAGLTTADREVGEMLREDGQECDSCGQQDRYAGMCRMDSTIFTNWDWVSRCRFPRPIC